MTIQIPKATSFVLVFAAFLASDGVTPATGKTIAITIGKAGGAMGNPNAGATNATEISSGLYKVTLDATDTGTSGLLAIRGAVATIQDVLIIAQINDGTALLDVAAGVETSLTVRQFMRLSASVLFSEASGLGTTTAVYRDFGDTKNRLSVTVDADGNRSAFGTRDAT